MKTRQSLVSNSSSQSFIIAYDVKDVCKHCGRKDPDLMDIISVFERVDSPGRNKLYCHGINDVTEQVLRWDESALDDNNESDSNIKEEVLEKLKNLPDTMDVFYASISNHAESIRDIIENMVDNKRAIIIYKQEV